MLLEIYHLCLTSQLYYELTGRDSLRNKLLKETGWDGVEDTINDNIRAKIKEIYSMA